MSKYKVVMIIDGEEEEQDEIFDSEAEASEHGSYLVGCYHSGTDILHYSNPGDYPEDDADADVDFDIIEIDDDDE